MVPFFRWISDYYKYPVGQVVKNALPGGLNIRDYASVAITEKGRNELDHGRLAPIAKDILSQLQSGTILVKDLYKKIDQDIPSTLLYTFERCGLITRKWELGRGQDESQAGAFCTPDRHCFDPWIVCPRPEQK